MDNKLKRLFDFQKFEKNSRLEKMLSEAEALPARLTEDELSQVYAAGSRFFPSERTAPNLGEKAGLCHDPNSIDKNILNTDPTVDYGREKYKDIEPVTTEAQERNVKKRPL